ncbi:hypothetical protein [Rhizobium sp. LEGMi135b]
MLHIRDMNRITFRLHRTAYRRNFENYDDHDVGNGEDNFPLQMENMKICDPDVNKQFGYYNPLQRRLELFREVKRLMTLPMWEATRTASFPHGLTIFAKKKVPLP